MVWSSWAFIVDGGLLINTCSHIMFLVCGFQKISKDSIDRIGGSQLATWWGGATWDAILIWRKG